MPPFWNIVSVALPAAAVLIGILVLSSARRSGDFAGALGGGVLFAFAMAAVCVLGEIAAITALWRGERLVWLSILGMLANGAVFLPVLFLLLRAD
jgi:hypothetical protein